MKRLGSLLDFAPFRNLFMVFLKEGHMTKLIESENSSQAAMDSYDQLKLNLIKMAKK